ncbi:MAG TPA: ferrous iron transporter B, partial [Oligoflexia bacterium]|nr:ferrous iron transporter B [Oligoflexia bacterium]
MFFDPSGCRNCAKPVVVARKGRIAAIAGTPNSGKTTIFNALTGLHYKVANYPGATVERKEAVVALPDGDKLTLVDLPGAYSVFGDSPDEIVAANYLSGLIEESRRPDIAICVLDVCNLDRSLYLALQVVDLGLPVVFAVTMADLGERRGIRLHKELLRRRLGAPVVDVSGRNPAALKELSALLRDSAVMIPPFSWCSEPQFRVVAHDLGERYLQINGIEADKLPATSLGIRLLNGSLTVLDEQLNKQILAGRTELETAGIDAVAYASVCGHNHVAEIARRAASASAETPSGFAERLDRIFLHKFWGAIFFVLVMGLLFNAVFIWAVYPMEAINSFFGLLRDFCRNWIPEGALRSLVADGIIAGVGGVLVFIPQIALLQFFIAILEETGYLSRAAFLMDNVMRRFGLQGRSFIPLLSSFSCTVPGIMLTRSIPSWPD